MDIITIVLEIIAVIASVTAVIAVFLTKKGRDDLSGELKAIKENSVSEQRELRQEITSGIQSSVKSLGDLLGETQKQSAEYQSKSITDMGTSLSERLSAMDKSLTDKQQAMSISVSEQMKNMEVRLRSLEANNEQKLDAIRETVSTQLNNIREDNNKKLDTIRNTVDEKLQKTLEDKMNESFKLVSERLEQVYKGLGEMQNIASGVGDLKKVLSNVKNRGILGEIQLGAILSEILAPEQYCTDIATVPKSTNRVEFAVKLPGNSEGESVFLPIDSKFPGDTYAALQDAYNSGSAEQIAEAKKKLETVIKKCAADIRDKYIYPPYTTNFGIMFLPFEGLYAEVVNSGLIEILQRDYSVNVTGPSTMAAMLNSLQMGFKTLAIQKRSGEVWKILGAVKNEFETFELALNETQKHLKKVDDDLEKLVGVRTRQINRKLKSIESYDGGEENLLTE